MGVATRIFSRDEPTVAAVYDRRRSVSATSPKVREAQARQRAPQSVDKRCRRSHGRVERLAMDGPLVSRYLTLARSLTKMDRRYRSE